MKLENIIKKSLKQLTELSENEIQNQIIDWSRANKILAIVVPNELARNNKSVKIEKGCSDLIVCLFGFTIYVELKSYCGTQSQDQIEFQLKVEALGHKYYICRSLDEFKTIVLIKC
jgi:hypothetical protein